MANKKEYATRFGMGLLAVLFLITSVGFSLLVIYQSKQENKKKTEETSQTTKNGGTKLEGTILKDFTVIDKVDSLQTIDTVVGTGAEAKADSTITAHYTGALAKTGVIFQSSLDSGSPLSGYPLSGLIKGWQEGIPGMKVGGTRRIIIPADQAYGAQSQPGIPANSDLVFDIQLLDLK